jgi:hypothetical protein
MCPHSCGRAQQLDSREKATRTYWLYCGDRLLDFLHSVHTEARYEEIIDALEGYFGDRQQHTVTN